MLHYTMQKGFWLLVTPWREYLPSTVPKKYFYHEKVTATTRAKDYRFLPLVACAKDVEHEESKNEN